MRARFGLAPLARLTDLRLLDLEDNQIEDLSPLSGLERLQFLVLNRNHTAGTRPCSTCRPWSASKLRANRAVAGGSEERIPMLQQRGVDVRFDVAVTGGEEPASGGQTAVGAWEYLGPEDETPRCTYGISNR